MSTGVVRAVVSCVYRSSESLLLLVVSSTAAMCSEVSAGVVRCADFYARVALMRHGSAVKTKSSDVIKRDVSPKFNESFVFKMAPDGLDTTSFVISIWQSVIGQKG